METVQGGVPPYGVKETLVVNGKYNVSTFGGDAVTQLIVKGYQMIK